MKKVFLSLASACMCILLASCGCCKKAVSTTYNKRARNITEIAGKAISSTNGTNPSIGFDLKDKRIYGNSGCNRMMGSFSTDAAKPGSLNLGSIASTRMACPDMSTEQSLLIALNDVKSFKIVSCNKAKGCKAILYGEDGKGLVTMEKQTEEANVAMLNGEWNIETVNGKALGKSEKVPFVGFDVAQGQVYGNAGCNSINGSMKPDANDTKALNFGPMACTMMMCPDMATERIVLDALNTVKSFNLIKGGKVALCNADGKEIIVLKKK
ncbi:MAG: META domain-containing protein [Bacteroides sp.]